MSSPWHTHFVLRECRYGPTSRTTSGKMVCRQTLFLIVLMAGAPLGAAAQTPSATPSPTPVMASDYSLSQKSAQDISDWLGLIMAAEAGGGWQANSSTAATVYGGVKLGLPFYFRQKPEKAYDLTLDIGYDRVRSNDAASVELSAMLPLFRMPGPQKEDKKNYLRVYVEPGVGYRGGGAIGGFGSVKMMMVLFSDYRLTASSAPASPFIEVQRRFPFVSPLQGDNRISVGLMIAICKHCGLD